MMSKLYQKLIFFCFLLISAMPSHVLAQEVEETTPYATVTDIQLNKNKVKAGDTIKYSFTITDIGTWKVTFLEDDDVPWFSDTGIWEIQVTWKSPGKQKIVRTYQWNNKRHMRVFQISDTIPVQKGMQPGTWRIEQIELSDYYTDRAVNMEISTLTIYDQRDKAAKGENPRWEFVDLSSFDFVVEGTKADNQAPKISKKSLKVSKKYMASKEKSTFSVKVTDSSKIEVVKALWSVWKKDEYFDAVKDYTMTYNKKKKCYECKVKIPSKSVKRIELHKIYVRDIYGNEKTYSGYSKNLRKSYSKVTIYRK